jgi:hypothetical protein
MESQMLAHGLDVTLRINELPFADNLSDEQFIEQWNDYSHPFWNDPNFHLIRVDLEHGPHWLEFVASNFEMEQGVHHHISLCYRTELDTWWKHLKNTSGWNTANEAALRWWKTYKTVRARYDGRRARLKGWKFTSGYTFPLTWETIVDGLDPPYILWDGFDHPESRVAWGCDEDVLYIHTLPGGPFPELIKQPKQKSSWYKSVQHMHVSMLIGDVEIGYD